jgi:hypothetical protein
MLSSADEAVIPSTGKPTLLLPSPSKRAGWYYFPAVGPALREPATFTQFLCFVKTSSLVEF